MRVYSYSELASFVTIADLQFRAVTCVPSMSCYVNDEVAARVANVEATLVRVFT